MSEIKGDFIQVKISVKVKNMEVAKQYSLLVFCDASMKAYTTAIYLHIEEQILLM